VDAATEGFLAAHPAHDEGRDDWPLDPVRRLPDEIPCELVAAEWALEVTEETQRPLLAAALRASGIAR
jgi:hypothetical protein